MSIRWNPGRAIEFYKNQMEKMKKESWDEKFKIEDPPKIREKVFVEAMVRRRSRQDKFVGGLFKTAETMNSIENKKIIMKVLNRGENYESRNTRISSNS